MEDVRGSTVLVREDVRVGLLWDLPSWGPGSLHFLRLPPCCPTLKRGLFIYHWHLVKKRGYVFIRKEEKNIY
jgi:hypothetical protein